MNYVHTYPENGSRDLTTLDVDKHSVLYIFVFFGPLVTRKSKKHQLRQPSRAKAISTTPASTLYGVRHDGVSLI